MVGFYLLRQPTCWDPPEWMIGDATLSFANWLQIPVGQLKSRLSKVNLGVIKTGFDLYLSPNHHQNLRSQSMHSCLALRTANVVYRGYEVDLSPVFDADGNLMFPPQYKDAIPDGIFVVARGSMKMYNIISPGKLHTRPYMITFQRLQVVGGRWFLGMYRKIGPLQAIFFWSRSFQASIPWRR
ncbi:hypothetical protein BDM02DRAFT_3126222 [Thelephora ganbajun]|uniref:Uncharacterized protein n=1 Tax=Thelephora ganbajun TaxID=370292 RepID=A0ACB6ZT21_THEGA|nr:hypothetical protein BDM02DRAFT_3126222 [Thelephora ganbajun]